MNESTHLRYISAETASELSEAVEQLPFMVEVKSIAPKGKRWFVWFTVTEANKKMKNIDL